MLTLDYMEREGCTPVLDEEEMLEICEGVLREEGVTRDCLVSISCVDNERIAVLNRDWRGIYRPTDVISLECERPDDESLLADEPCELGDIILAPAYIKEQAVDLSVDERLETSLLIIHGMLHLLGYDHLEDEEARVMEAREDELLEMLVGHPGHVTLTRHEDERA